MAYDPSDLTGSWGAVNTQGSLSDMLSRIAANAPPPASPPQPPAGSAGLGYPALTLGTGARADLSGPGGTPTMMPTWGGSPGGPMMGSQWSGGRDASGNPNMTSSGYPAMVGPTMDPTRPGYFAGPTTLANPVANAGFGGPMPALLSPGGGTGMQNPNRMNFPGGARAPVRAPVRRPAPAPAAARTSAPSPALSSARAQAPAPAPSGLGSVLRFGPGGPGRPQQMVALAPSSANVLSALFGGRRG